MNVSRKVLHCLAVSVWLAWVSLAWSGGLPASHGIFPLFLGPTIVPWYAMAEAPENRSSGNSGKAPLVDQTQKPQNLNSVEPKLNMESLKQRLRETNALGFFTKLELRNQVSELLDSIGRVHKGGSDKSIAQLRERYNLLVLKVLTLLEGKDARLHQDIAASREELWSILTDPVKFEKL